MKINLSSEQKSILEEVSDGSNLLITAAAGAGKTFTLQEIARRNPHKRFLYLAFNTSVANEARGTMPNNVTSLTTHSFCRKVVIRDLGDGKVDLKRKPKAWRFYSDCIAPLGGIQKLGGQTQLYSKWCREWIAAYCRSDKNSTIPDEDTKSIHSQIAKYYIQKAIGKLLDQLEDGEPPEVSPSAYVEDIVDQSELVLDRIGDISNILADKICEDKEHWSDFEGWVKYCALKPASTNSFLQQYDCVLIDEAQDTNSATIQIIEACPGIQKIWVGDEFQQIYAWRGAISAFKKLRDKGDYKELSLSTSYRFGQDIANLANSILHGYYDEALTVHGGGSSAHAKVTGALLCRTNAGVFAAVIDKLKSAQSVCIPEATKLAEKVEAYFAFYQGGNPPHEINGLVKDWNQLMSIVKSPILSTVLEFETIKFVGLINEYPEHIEKLIKYLPQCDPDNTKYELDQSAPAVMTTHKAKGLEWDAVAIHSDFVQMWEHTFGDKKPDRIDKFAEHSRFKLFERHFKALTERFTLLREQENDGKFDEEVNLFYVALTRSKAFVTWGEDVTAGIQKWNNKVDLIREILPLVKRGNY